MDDLRDQILAQFDNVVAARKKMIDVMTQMSAIDLNIKELYAHNISHPQLEIAAKQRAELDAELFTCSSICTRERGLLSDLRKARALWLKQLELISTKASLAVKKVQKYRTDVNSAGSPTAASAIPPPVLMAPEKEEPKPVAPTLVPKADKKSDEEVEEEVTDGDSSDYDNVNKQRRPISRAKGPRCLAIVKKSSSGNDQCKQHAQTPDAFLCGTHLKLQTKLGKIDMVSPPPARSPPPSPALVMLPPLPQPPPQPPSTVSADALSAFSSALMAAATVGK